MDWESADRYQRAGLPNPTEPAHARSSGSGSVKLGGVRVRVAKEIRRSRSGSSAEKVRKLGSLDIMEGESWQSRAGFEKDFPGGRLPEE